MKESEKKLAILAEVQEASRSGNGCPVKWYRNTQSQVRVLLDLCEEGRVRIEDGKVYFVRV